MAAPYSTPGVYIVEKNAFPNSVVQVDTALPAFIGFTQKASFNGKDLTNIPTRVDSMKEFEDYFGMGFVQTFTLTGPPAKVADDANAKPVEGDQPAKTAAAEGTKANPLVAASELTLYSDPTNTYSLAPAGATPLHYLYNSIRLFYTNGGSTCYIVSVGDYKAEIKADSFIAGIDTLVYEQDPTMVLCPDALRLEADGYNEVMQKMLAHCEDVQSRVALFDLRDGAISKTTQITQPVDDFRNAVGQNFLKYGVAYFPWVNTSIISPTDISFVNLDSDSLTLLKGLLNPGTIDGKPLPAGRVEVLVPGLPAATTAKPAADDKEGASVPDATAKPDPVAAQNIFDQAIALLKEDAIPTPNPAPENYSPARALADKRRAIDNSLQTLYPDYKLIIKAITHYLNTLPVAPAMAGVYTAVDSSRGVWKAPANWSLSGVVSPTVSLSDKDQGRLNVDAITGKSINVIRAFKGMGVLVWGARTLDGNSQDWRYVNVRRTMIMIEQSVKLAAHSYVFEPNDANTWTTVKSAIDSFLFNLWKQGALAGAVPADAYQVLVGLGSTMTADDILNGYMNVTVLVAIVRPAEFIELTFQQQMQKS